MRLDDRAMTVLTGLILAIVVGMIAQQSSNIIDLFTTKYRAELADDYFLVKAGRPQELDLLLNDRLENVEGVIEIAAPPRCGKVTASRGIVIYEGGNACAGNVTFSYCVKGTESCEPAIVSMNVRKDRADIRVVAAAERPQPKPPTPTLVKAPVAEKAFVASLTAPEPVDPPPASVTATFLAIADALESQGGLSLDQTARHADEFVVAALDPEARLQPRAALRFVDQGARAPIQVPQATPEPDIKAGLQPLEISGEQAFADMAGCRAFVAARARPLALLEVNLSGACFANQQAEVHHAGLRFAAHFDADGKAAIRFPALHQTGEVLVYFPGAKTPLVARSRVPDLSGLHRSAVIIDKSTGLNLRAREYNPATRTNRLLHAADGQRADNTDGPGGRLTSYRGAGNQNIFVYSHPVVAGASRKFAELLLTGQRDKACNKTAQVETLLADGQPLPRHTVRIELPACTSGGSFESHLRDITIAAR